MIRDQELVQVIFDTTCEEIVVAAVEGVSRSYKKFALRPKEVKLEED